MCLYLSRTILLHRRNSLLRKKYVCVHNDCMCTQLCTLHVYLFLLLMCIKEKTKTLRYVEMFRFTFLHGSGCRVANSELHQLSLYHFAYFFLCSSHSIDPPCQKINRVFNTCQLVAHRQSQLADNTNVILSAYIILLANC